MRRDEAFADVLDRELGRTLRQHEPGASSAWQTRRPASPSPFLFTSYQSMATPAVAPRKAAAPPPAPERPRPARVLAPREQRALRELIALGADLCPEFTAVELRHAFRILARRYHPDCHPDCDDAARARLSRTFAGLADNHRCLLAVVAPVGPIRH